MDKYKYLKQLQTSYHEDKKYTLYFTIVTCDYKTIKNTRTFDSIFALTDFLKNFGGSMLPDWFIVQNSHATTISESEKLYLDDNRKKYEAYEQDLPF